MKGQIDDTLALCWIQNL